MATIPAKYDSNRDAMGHFVKGNTASNCWSSALAQRFREIQARFLTACTDEDIDMIHDELKALCKQNDNFDVKLKALIYFTDRYLGKVQDRIAVDVQSDQPVSVNLSPNEVEVLSKVVERS